VHRRATLVAEPIKVRPCSGLKCNTVVVWFCVVLVDLGWCCLAEAFLGLVVVLGDDLLEFLSVTVQKSVRVGR